MGSFANADEGTRRRLRAIVVFMRSPAANESPNQRRAMPGKNRGYRSDLACCSYRLSSGKSNPQKLKSCKNSKPTSVCPAVPVEPRCTTRALVPRFPSGHQRKICSSTAKPARVLSQSSMTGNDDRLSHFNSGLGRCYRRAVATIRNSGPQGTPRVRVLLLPAHIHAHIRKITCEKRGAAAPHLAC